MPSERHTRGVAQQDAAIRGLVSEGTLSEAQYQAVLWALAGEKPRLTRRVGAEIAAYVGAGLVLAGIGVLFDESWEQWTSLVRAGILLLVAVIAGFAGTRFAGGARALFRGKTAHTPATRVAAVLFGVAAPAAAGAVRILLGGGEDRVPWPGWVAFVLAVAGYWAIRSPVGILVSGASGVIAVSDTVSLVPVSGWSLREFAVLALGLGWLALTRAGVVTERWAGYLVGALIAIGSAQAIELDSGGSRWVAHVITLAVAGVLFALYLGDRRWVLVLTGTVATAVAVGQLVSRWTHSVGGGIAVVIVGVVVLAAGGVVLLRTKNGASETRAG